MHYTKRIRIFSAVIMPVMLLAGSLSVHAQTPDAPLLTAGAGSLFSINNINVPGTITPLYTVKEKTVTLQRKTPAGDTVWSHNTTPLRMISTSTYTAAVQVNAMPQGDASAQVVPMTATNMSQQTASETAVEYSTLVISNVDDFVNVRELPDVNSNLVGKFYGGNIGVILEKNGDWLKISSGNVTGYVMAEYCLIDSEAALILESVKVLKAQVNTNALNIREEASLTCTVQDTVPFGATYEVLEELDEWVRINDGSKEGFLYKEYIKLFEEFTYAETLEEERARLKEEREKEEARMAAVLAQNASVQRPQTQSAGTAPTQQSTTTSYTDAATYATTSSDLGVAVAEFAQQFVGNPYVWGGTSLTEGADCSGFTMAVYANFGVSLPHGSAWQRSSGVAVDGLENAAPGDLICYSGHVALYIGGGQIVHASDSRSGIIISNANYRSFICIRRIFQ